MNRTRSGTRVGDDVARSVAELGVGRLDTSLANRVIYADALGRGLGAVEAKKSGPAADEVRALAKEVAAILAL